MLLNRRRADEIMDRERVEALVVSSPINTYYVSSWATDPSWGFGDLALAILPRDHGKEGAVLTIEIDAGQPQQRDGTWMRIVPRLRAQGGNRPRRHPDGPADPQ